MCKILYLFLLGVFALKTCNAHSYGFGQCPEIPHQEVFDMEKFLGVWYVIQESATDSSCKFINITTTNTTDVYKIEETRQLYVLNWLPVDSEFTYEGDLYSESSNYSKMMVEFPYSNGAESYTVFLTDYVNYAGVFSCRELAFIHRKSAAVLSRTRTLDKKYVDAVRTRMASYNVNPFDMNVIYHKHCSLNTSKEFEVDDRSDIYLEYSASETTTGKFSGATTKR